MTIGGAAEIDGAVEHALARVIPEPLALPEDRLVRHL